MHGSGCLLSKSGREFYSGTFVCGFPYEGEMKDSLPNGHGKSFYYNGRLEYEGEWKDGKKNGYGKLYRRYSRDRMLHVYYEGGFKDNSFHGMGTLYKPNSKEVDFHGYFIEGAVYEGELKNDKPNGEGTLFVDDHIAYKGGFKDGLRHGHGISYRKDGRILFDGEWRDGKPVRK